MALRVLVPLLSILAALTCGATQLVNKMTRSWFERDVALRARLVTSGAREAVATHVRSGDRRKLAAVLDEIARDDRILAASVCTPSMRTLARTGAVPPRFSCEGLALRVERGVPRSGLDLLEDADGGLVHAVVVPVIDDDEELGEFVVVHDLSFVARREAAMRRYTIGAF
ncbi:MAG TPA: trehalose-6-phosphate synthase, partial [Anaeromyxobacter sp.]|nr:trehalose-6-phosphate synthase [Anaeromyxobacter sp.]